MSKDLNGFTIPGLPFMTAGGVIRIAKLAAFLALLAGCAVGPDFKHPESPKADRYSAAADPTATVSVDGQVQRFATGLEVSPDWWELYDSPELNLLVATGLKNNPTIAAAQATLKQSEQDLRAGQGVFYPEIDLGADFTRQRLSPLRLGGSGPGTIFNLYTSSAAIGYTLDVFGLERRTVEGLAAQVDAQRAAAQATYLSLIGNILNTSIAAAAYRADAETTQRLIALQKEQLAMVEAQAEAGLVQASNIVAVKLQLSANEAVLPAILQRKIAAEDLLATLIGFVPAEAKLPKLALENIQLPVTLPISLPSNLVRQRPDILAAEASLHVASAQVGIATAQLFPTFSLTGNYGSNSQHINSLGDSKSRFWSIGSDITYPLFQGGSALARKEAAQAGYESSLARYRQTVLSAFGQVADTLQALAHDAEVSAARRQALNLAVEQQELVNANHEAGIVGDLEWLIAGQQVETARIAMTDALAQRHQDTVALFVALGGGWWNAQCQEKGMPKIPCPPTQPETQMNHAADVIPIIRKEGSP